MIILPQFSLFMHPWYTTFFLKSTAIYKEQLSMKKKYLACQRQNILHPVLWLECQRHSLAITEMNVRLCFPSILLLDALWHWAVDIQKIIDLLLETREKSTTHMNVKKQNKKTPNQNISITLAVCSGYDSKTVLHISPWQFRQSSVTCSHSLWKTWVSRAQIVLAVLSHYRVSRLYLILIIDLTDCGNMCLPGFISQWK